MYITKILINELLQARGFRYQGQEVLAVTRQIISRTLLRNNRVRCHCPPVGSVGGIWCVLKCLHLPHPLKIGQHSSLCVRWGFRRVSFLWNCCNWIYLKIKYICNIDRQNIDISHNLTYLEIHPRRRHCPTSPEIFHLILSHPGP